MALTEEELEEIGRRMASYYQELEQNTIADIARRVKKTGRYTETAELMVTALREQGMSPSRIRVEVMKLLRADAAYQKAVAENTIEYKQYVASEIKRVTAEALEEGNRIVADAGMMSFNSDLSAWEAAGKSLSEPGGFAQLLEAMSEQTDGELRNLTRSLGFKGMGFTPLEQAYQHQMDLGLIRLTSGAYSWQQVVNDCVRELAQSGLRTVDFASGRSMQLDTAARNAIMTASSQLSGRITMLNLESTGETLVEVAAHWGARSDGSRGHADHAYWQGKVYATDKGRHRKEGKRLGYAIQNLEDATGYPSDPLGLHGYNCRHTMYPFFEGISEPNVWDPEPEPVTVNGRKYTYYQATQRQRQMERQIRATKREIEAQNALGGDTTELRSRLKKQTADYRSFSSDVGIRPKNERLRVQAGTSDITKTQAYKKYQASAQGSGKEYRIRSHTSGVNTTNERRAVNEAVASVPPKVQQKLQNTIIDVGKNGASQYDYSHDILYIAKNADKTDVVHEIGHMVENKMLDPARVEELKATFLKDIPAENLVRETYYDASGNPVEIFLLKDPRFVSDYQGRLYISDWSEIYDENKNVRPELLQEFISEPFREYIQNPQRMKEEFPEFYKLFEELIK